MKNMPQEGFEPTRQAAESATLCTSRLYRLLLSHCLADPIHSTFFKLPSQMYTYNTRVIIPLIARITLNTGLYRGGGETGHGGRFYLDARPEKNNITLKPSVFFKLSEI